MQAPPAPAPPAEPGPPVFGDWACPAGWRTETVLADTPQAHTVCAPPALPEGCPDGMAPVLGQKECQLIGDPTACRVTA